MDAQLAHTDTGADHHTPARQRRQRTAAHAIALLAGIGVYTVARWLIWGAAPDAQFGIFCLLFVIVAVAVTYARSIDADDAPSPGHTTEPHEAPED